MLYGDSITAFDWMRERTTSNDIEVYTTPKEVP